MYTESRRKRSFSKLRRKGKNVGLKILRNARRLLRIVRWILNSRVPSCVEVANDRLGRHLLASVCVWIGAYSVLLVGIVVLWWISFTRTVGSVGSTVG